MPGVSSRGPVSAADGFGKVHLKFKVKQKRTHYLGAFLYTTFFILMFFVFGWKRPYLKDNILIPVVRSGFGLVENLIGFYGRIGSNNIVPRNQNGIAFISGHSLLSVLSKQGYIHSVDRFVQMELYRRTVQGRLSELLGKRSIEVDKLSLSLNFIKSAQSDYDLLDNSDKEVLNAYCEGVNKYISELTSVPSWLLPLEYATVFETSFTTLQPLVIDEWQPIHSLAIIRLLAYEWSSGWEDQVIALLAEADGRAAPITVEKGGHLLPSLGGHVFAVSGKHTLSGGALLAGSSQSQVCTPALFSHFV
jgi:acyl-homoserine lactone acylase PvdQ